MKGALLLRARWRLLARGKREARVREGTGAGVMARVALVAGVLLAGALALVATVGPRTTAPGALAPAPARESAPAAAPAQSPTPASTPAPAPAPAPKPAPVRVTLEGPFEPADAVTFVSRGGGAVTLADVEGPGPEAVCAGADGRRWACGLQARAALVNALRGQAPVCEIAERMGKRHVRARCRVGEPDLAGLLVAGGWARPAAGAGDAYADDLAAARAARAGLWAGDWTIVLAGRPTTLPKPASRPAPEPSP